MNKLRLCLTNLASINSINYGGYRHIKRWVAPTKKELSRRKRLLKDETVPKRNTFIEWNRDAEIFAFNERLKEKFNIEKLNQAFVHKSYILEELKKQEEMGISDPKLDIQDNEEFIKKGKEITSEFIKTHLGEELPNLPELGIMALHDYLMSQTILAKASLHIGTKDIILTAEHPANEETLAQTFLALVGALAESVNIDHARNFIKDFLIVGLAEKDLTEIWNPVQPFEMLRDFLSKETNTSIEARIIGKAGTNTILSAYHIGIYSNKEFLGSGFGQTIEEAKNVAASNILANMFGISESSQPLQFNK
ncbi:mitochondrial ribosomal protein L44 [Megachile rotundata]|uniref:mitochondrial ribosomal protein L44 n=1 Tax=Megachile rotundata TaxID=143995 RepID=UPI000614CC84|nr:PREDICTED: 39S ribosomal protein L44, mitochondrial [Megachile rotundata]XP_012146097.1 PREDICTED: 39S ribosomal protein L44, mitochondrial [Megachile rotundata]